MRTLPSYKGVEPQNTAPQDTHMPEYLLSCVPPYTPGSSPNPVVTTTASPGHAHSSGAAESHSACVKAQARSPSQSCHPR